jgi:hypothetical protein
MVSHVCTTVLLYADKQVVLSGKNQLGEVVRRRFSMRSLIGLCVIISLTAGCLSSTAQDEPPVDGGWPRIFTTPSGGEIALFAPQVASWDNQNLLVGFCAVSYIPKGATKSELGTVKFESATQVSIEERLVNLANLKFTESNFQTLSKDKTREVMAELAASFPDTARVLALDRVLVAIDMSQVMPQNVDGIKADPPLIFFSKRPAVIVIFDGNPIWSPIKDNDLKFAVNTNWDAFQHTPSNTLYLRIEESWLKAPDLKGPWTPAGELPASFTKLPDDDNWREVKAHLPGKKLSDKETPTVFVTVESAELILLDGEPEYVAVTGTQLHWVSNCEADVFRAGTTGDVYFLTSGRWFAAPDFTGPWVFATLKLPEDFKNIPPEHERSDVLASVPGTDAAAQAILLSQIPQTAVVNKSELKAPEVAYLGDPAFKTIEGTTCQQATNTDKDIIKVGDLYYMCFQGVWFMSRTPTGPWEVTGEVPTAIYSIPPSSECHHVTYVVVQDYHPADVHVTFAYTSGYTGVVIAWGVPVYGTGWYYPPYVYWGYPYPVYYPRWTTYGCAVRYNPWTGVYATSTRVYGPYGGARYGAAYNPRTGTYARGAAVYGPYGAAGAAHAWNPRTGAYGATRQGANAYGSWGETYVQRGDQWVHTQRQTNAITGQTKRLTETNNGAIASSRGPQGNSFVGTNGDNVYAGHDGNVYKKDESGNWSKYENGDWSNVNSPSPRSEEAQAKTTQQTKSKETAKSSTATAQTNSQTKKAGATTAQSSAQQKQSKETAKSSTATAQTNSQTKKAGATTAQSSAQAKKPGAATSAKPSSSSALGQLDHDSSARSQGAKQTNEYSKQRSQGSKSGASRSTGGSGGRRR